METLIKKSEKNGKRRSLKTSVLLFSFMVLFIINVIGAINTENSLALSKEDEKAAVAQAQHEEFMGYIYMALGFGAILGVAWFTVVGKKKKTGNSEKEKSPVIKQHQLSSYDKRYGSRSRG